MTRLAAFDVFDTVLTRMVGGPRQVFVETGQRLRRADVIDVDAEAYAAAREQAAADLTTDVARHPTLAAVADELAARLGLPAGVATDLAAAELAVESDVCRAVPGAVWQMQQQRQRTGRGLAYLSDTSLPHELVQQLLVREGLFVAGDVLYTSSAAGASKQDGALFDLVAADLGVPAPAISFRGNDRWSDVANGRLHGWQAALEGGAEFDAHERRLDAEAVTTSGIGPRLAAASRMGRLRAVEEGIEPALAAIACGVALPLLAGFGFWVLRQAELLALDRLYFVARDGEVFLDVVRPLAAAAGADVECRYLYGSRHSWQLAAATSTAGLWTPDDVPGEALTVAAALRLVDLRPEDAAAITGDALFAPAAADQVLGAAGWRAFTHLVAGPLAAEVQGRAQARRDLLVRYADQEGVTAPGRVGLVDVGWTGRAARSLEDVLTAAERPLPAAHLFLGLLGTAPERMGAELFGRSRGWLLDEARGRGSRSGEVDPVMLVETFAMGSEGHTTGYRTRGDRVVPQLAAPANPAAQGWEFSGYRRALELAVAALLDGPIPDAGVDLRTLVWQQLLSLWRAPTRAEAAVWGDQPYGEDFANAEMHPLASPATGRRLLARLGLGDPDWREPTYWLAGTIARSRQPWRAVLRAAETGQRTARRTPRIPARLRGELAMRSARR